MEHGPLVRQVLAGRQPRGVVARRAGPCPRPSTGRGPSRPYTSQRDFRDFTGGRAPAARLRARLRAARRGLSAAHAVERRGRARPRPDVRGAAPDGQGPADRAGAGSSGARPRGLPAADGAGARRAAAPRARADGASPPGARSSRRSTSRTCPSAATGPGLPTAELGVPAVEVLDEPEPADAVALAPDELERLRIRARDAALGARARRPGAAGGGGTDRDARSASRRAAIRGRSRSRGSTTAGTRTAGCACSSSKAPSCRRSTRRSTWTASPSAA